MNKYLKVAFCIDPIYTQHCTVAIASLIENNPDTLEHIYVICPEIEHANIQLLTKYVKDHQINITTLSIQQQQFETFWVSNHVSHATYYRILLGNLLPKEIDKILYLDSDILVLNNLSQLWNTDLKDHYLGAIKDNVSIDHKEKLHLPLDYNYFNAGIMLLNLKKWREENIGEKLYNLINARSKEFTYWDQDAFNIMMRDQCLLLDNSWNVQVWMLKERKSLKDVKILHFTGQSKPWEYMNRHPFKYLYYQFLKKTPFKKFRPTDQTIGNFFRKYNLLPAFVEKFLIWRKNHFQKTNFMN